MTQETNNGNGSQTITSTRTAAAAAAAATTTTTITTTSSPDSKAASAIAFAAQAEKLGHLHPHQTNGTTTRLAASAEFITAQDPIIKTQDGGRLPAVPLDEALKLNRLRADLEDEKPLEPAEFHTREGLDGTIHGVEPPGELEGNSNEKKRQDAPLGKAMPPSKTNPLFPPLPMYGPPSLMRDVHALAFRASSAVLSFLFLMVIVLGALFTSIPEMWEKFLLRLKTGDAAKARPFYEEEKRRAEARQRVDSEWVKKQSSAGRKLQGDDERFVPTEGGPDPLVCDVAYYARRVGLDCEIFNVQTEDGFIIELWHILNPLEQRPKPPQAREPLSPSVFEHQSTSDNHNAWPNNALPGKPGYPILLIPGLLQSAGAYCCTEEHSLAFYLAKRGLDVWLGNNRAGFVPRHTLLSPSDPRMWNWNIRQMGVLDLPALISRVLAETSSPKLALVAHSQGTTQTLVALAQEQRPEIGDKISVVCLLAPAAYAGPLIDKIYLKIMRVMSRDMFRATFGIHAFIPFMMTMHRLLPGKLYGFMGYRVFKFLFGWSDRRWDRGLRDRCFQFAPVYVSAESMRWWLGRECFAKQRCILSTRSETEIEDRQDQSGGRLRPAETPDASDDGEDESRDVTPSTKDLEKHGDDRDDHDDGDDHEDDGDATRHAWYDSHVPPFAIWVAGNDDLVDGKRFLRRFRRGREPHVRVVHEKIIPEYEHLDVIWAVDMVEQVGKEIVDVVRRTMPGRV